MPFLSFYSGWRVLAGGFISAALAIGFTTYIIGMFTVPVTEEFGLSRTAYNNGAIGMLLGIAFASPIAGKLLDHYSARAIMIGASFCFSGALMLISRIDSLWLMLLLLSVAVPMGVSACGVVGANTVVVRWFSRRRGQALGILALCTSVGGFISQPLTGWLITNLGWRDALFSIGLGTLIIYLLIHVFVIRNRPSEDMPGYDREFSHTPQAEESAKHYPDSPLWTQKQLLTNRNFWLVAAGIGLFFGVDQAVLVSQVPFFQSIGYDLQTTSILVAVKTGSAIGGKLLVGYLADKMDLRRIFIGVAGCNVLLLSIYIMQPGYWVLLASVAMLGIAVGGVFPVWTTLTAWVFGVRSYGTCIGLMAIVMQPFAMVSVRFIGEVYDRTGSYVPAFGTFIGLVMLAIVLINLVRPPEHVPAARTDSI